MDNFSKFEQSTSYSAAPELYITHGLEDLQIEHTAIENTMTLKPFSMTIIQ